MAEGHGYVRLLAQDMERDMARARSLSTLADGAVVAIPGVDALTGSRSAGSQSGLDGFWLKGLEL